MEMLKDFENSGKTIEENGKKRKIVYGDLFPVGLTSRQQENLKTVADRLYGNYDKETKSLMQEQLLGAL